MDENVQKVIILIISVVVLGVIALMFFMGSAPQTVSKSSCYYFVSMYDNMYGNLFSSFYIGFVRDSINRVCPVYEHSVTSNKEFMNYAWTDAVNCWEQYGSGLMNPFAGGNDIVRRCSSISFSNIDLTMQDFVDYVFNKIPGRSEIYNLISNEDYGFPDSILLCVKDHGECTYALTLDEENKRVILKDNQITTININEGLLRIYYADDWYHEWWAFWESGKVSPKFCKNIDLPSEFVKNGKDAIIFCFELIQGD